MVKKYSTGQILYEKAKKLIPGGTMLLSKRPEMFLPDNWPSYYSRAKGCIVWDLENRQYTDMIMGIGPNALGYAHKEVDQAVSKAILGGNMSTLNCPEEVHLAEKLIELHPWSDMVRFARTGGEANAIAIRIARAASQKDNVAICGYHGWHDWYLSVNIGTNGLDQHLISGLNPVGVPKNLSETTFPFQYNNFDQLVKLIDEKNIGVIKMEVQRNEAPRDNFLAKVRELATKKNIVLIFDECSSGFRETFGGLHKKFGINPDMAMFGKTIGNGYAVTAVIGTKDVMEHAQRTFISSTFWTEKIGSVAALKTIEVMEDIESWNILPEYGRNIKDSIEDLARYHDLRVNFFGIDPLLSFAFDSPNNLLYKTYMTQEMLKKGFLTSNIFYVSIEQTPKIVRKFLEALDPIFKILKECEEGLDIIPLLDGPVCHSSFERLN